MTMVEVLIVASILGVIMGFIGAAIYDKFY